MNHSYKKQTLSLMGLGSGMARVLKRRKKEEASGVAGTEKNI
jgi:hypothetical protein